MSELFIRRALELHLDAMLPPLPTVWQNRTPDPGFDASAPHQKAYLLRSKPESLGLTQRTTLHTGIFQVSLCYPTGKGTAEVEARAVALQSHFAPGMVLENEGVKVRIRALGAIGDPVTTAPYVVPVSIRYESFIS